MLYYPNKKNELMHYGILGMKWGIRRTKEELVYNCGAITSIVNSRASKIKARGGYSVTKMSDHALDRIEDRDDRKVTAKEIVDALEKPMHVDAIRIDKQGRPSVRYIGRKATVNLNPETGVIPTVWITGRDKIVKYSQEDNR